MCNGHEHPELFDPQTEEEWASEQEERDYQSMLDCMASDILRDRMLQDTNAFDPETDWNHGDWAAGMVE